MWDMYWVLLGVSVLLVVACGVFGAAEYSFGAIDRSAVERAANAGDRRARGLGLPTDVTERILGANARTWYRGL